MVLLVLTLQARLPTCRRYPVGDIGMPGHFGLAADPSLELFFELARDLGQLARKMKVVAPWHGAAPFCICTAAAHDCVRVRSRWVREDRPWVRQAIGDWMLMNQYCFRWQRRATAGAGG